MSIRFTGTHTCEKCGKSYEWNYYEGMRNRLDTAQCLVETIPFDKHLVYSFTKNNSGNYDVFVNCPHCCYENRFIYSPSKYQNEE